MPGQKGARRSARQKRAAVRLQDQESGVPGKAAQTGKKPKRKATPSHHTQEGSSGAKQARQGQDGAASGSGLNAAAPGGPGVIPCPPVDAGRVGKTVWIMGSSYIYWAGRRAESKIGGSHLGLGPRLNVTLYWIGRRGMRWSSLYQAVKQKLRTCPVPDVLLIHLGSNDLCSVKLKSLMGSMCADFGKLQVLLPGTKLGYSQMLPRLKWRDARNIMKVETARKRANRSVSGHVLNLGGFVVRHPDISHSLSGLYREDGVHLTDIGNDFFLNIFEGALEGLMTRDTRFFPCANY